MKALHTPGPWRWKGTFNPIVEKADETDRICEMLDHSPKDYANAKLIACAPDLLKACKTILLNLDPEGDHPKRQHVLYSDCLGPENDDQTVVEYLKGVIAKAET